MISFYGSKDNVCIKKVELRGVEKSGKLVDYLPAHNKRAAYFRESLIDKKMIPLA